MTHPSIPQLVAIAREAAEAAATYIRTLDRSDIAREYKKSPQDIVTVHDKKAERIIRDVIEREAPSARIVGEEGGVVEGSSNVTFYVDPIDGTSNFAAGLPLFAVSIGVALDEVLEGGVINAPALDQEFYSDHTGAYIVTNEGVRRLGPHRTKPAHDSLVLTSFPGWKDLHEHPQFSAAALQDLKHETSAVRSLGTAALELAYVAAGWADAAMLTSIAPWDVAAGFHLVQAAGGSLRTWSASSQDADAPPHLHPAYVACAGTDRIAVLDDIQEKIHAQRTRREDAS